MRGTDNPRTKNLGKQMDRLFKPLRLRLSAFIRKNMCFVQRWKAYFSQPRRKVSLCVVYLINCVCSVFFSGAVFYRSLRGLSQVCKIVELFEAGLYYLLYRADKYATNTTCHHQHRYPSFIVFQT